MYKAELHKFFQKSSIHLKISGTRKVTRSRFRTDAPQILGAPPDARDLSTKSVTYFPDRLNLIKDLNRLVALYFESVVYVNGIRYK
jgi:hypothetical protein